MEVIGLALARFNFLRRLVQNALFPASTRRNPRIFRGLQLEESDAFPAEQYRCEGFALHAEKAEAARRVRSYGDAWRCSAVCPLGLQVGVRRTLMSCMRPCRLWRQSFCRMREERSDLRASEPGSAPCTTWPQQLSTAKHLFPMKTCAQCLSAEATRHIL